jgi:pimeloyl-ACP methyl ester carboxylesterase
MKPTPPAGRRPPRSRLRRLGRGVLIGLLAAVLGLYLVLPAAFGAASLAPTRAPVGPPPAGFAAVTLATDDGLALQAWYAPPDNGAAIILIHGAGSSRETLRPYAALLRRHGYGVLALDLRGHGQSGGRTNRFAWQGSRDVSAAVAFLALQPEVAAIGGLGLSAGGEALLGAAAASPQIKAIVADGATQRCTAELLALESERPLVRNFTARVMYASVQLLSGEDPPAPLLAEMLRSGSTAFLWIAGGAEPQEVAFNQLFAASLGDRGALWVAPGAGHVGALAAYPDEYEDRISAFLGKKLLENRE